MVPNTLHKVLLYLSSDSLRDAIGVASFAHRFRSPGSQLAWED